jgi:hypothetical protein
MWERTWLARAPQRDAQADFSGPAIDRTRHHSINTNGGWHQCCQQTETDRKLRESRAKMHVRVSVSKRGQ